MKKRTLFFLLCLLLGFAGRHADAKSYRHSYKKSLKQATRSQELYQREDFHASLKWQATWLNAEFLQAWSNEHARIYHLSESERQAYLAELEQKFSGFDAFFVNFYSYDYRESDLTNLKSVWHLRLPAEDADGEGVQPVKVTKISKPDSYLKRIFPYIDVWSSHCYVFFPKGTQPDGHMTLNVFGPTGKSHLSWAE